MKECFTELANTIRKLSDGRTVLYIPNPGNFGDALIRYGTLEFFKDHDIKVTEINVGMRAGKLQAIPARLTQRDPLFIYGGGGAWSRSYRFGYTTCSFLSRISRDLLVLPSTFEVRGSDSIKATLFRRDEEESAEICPRSHFCPDMALYLYAKGFGDRFRFLQPAVESGSAFRTDGESAQQHLPDDNIDISAMGDHMGPADQFLYEISKYKTLRTDRLHVAIGALVLGREVLLSEGNYFKIRAIYNSCLVEVPEVTLVQA